MTFSKNQLGLSVAVALASVAMAPQAVAASKNQVADVKTEMLEARMQQMADQMQAMQAELSRVKADSAKTSSTDTAKVQELDQWMASMKNAPEATRSKDNLVAVRGGWSSLDHGRGNTVDGPFTDGGLLSYNGNNDGFYFGGAFDFNVNNDLFGLMDDTSFAIELGIEYAQYGEGTNTLTNGTAVVPVVEGGTGAARLDAGSQRATDARLRINASPKIKFMHNSKFRPWIIPVGLDINILGVPSNAVSVLNSGMQFGAGAEYDLFRGIVLGSDVRYHYSTSKLDGTPTDGFTAGGYLGFKF